VTYRFDEHVIGYPPIELVVPVPPALTPLALPISPGSMYSAEDPVWGPGEFVFARAGGGIRLFGGCQYLPVWDATNKVYQMNMIEWTATANAGRSLYVYQGNTALTAGQYGWFMTSGRTPLNCGASIAAGVAFGHNAAGQGSADAATFGVEGALVVTPATQTFTTAMLGGNVGSNQIFVASTQGLFPGVYVSGTGVGVAAIVSFVDPLGKYILVTVVNTATPISGNLTALYNNATIFYNVIDCNRMHGADEA
jgi:hypothetical protein